MRAKLDPLRAPGAERPDAKELQGRRIYWKLAGTEYEWIMAWASPERKVTRVRGVFRPEKRPAFAELGNLETALTVDAATVRWNLRTAAGIPYRLTAQGTNHRAFSVYMFSQELSPAETRAAESNGDER